MPSWPSTLAWSTPLLPRFITSVIGKGSKRNTNLSVAVKWDAIAFGSDEFRQTNLGMAMRKAVTSAAQQLAEKAYSSGRGPALPEKIAGMVARFLLNFHL